MEIVMASPMRKFLDAVGEYEGVSYPDVYEEAIAILSELLPHAQVESITQAYVETMEGK